jgi:hypothetical protein
MQKQYHNADDDFEIVRGKKVLKDGRIFRTKMTAMDNAISHRPIARVTTADGDPLSMHRPGWRLAATHDADPPEFSDGVAAADRQAIIDAMQQYEDELTSAWQHHGRRKVQARNAKGQETGTYEEEEEDGS